MFFSLPRTRNVSVHVDFSASFSGSTTDCKLLFCSGDRGSRFCPWPHRGVVVLTKHMLTLVAMRLHNTYEGRRHGPACQGTWYFPIMATKPARTSKIKLSAGTSSFGEKQRWQRPSSAESGGEAIIYRGYVVIDDHTRGFHKRNRPPPAP